MRARIGFHYAELAESVCREKSFFFGAPGHNHFRPMNHRCSNELKCAGAQTECAARMSERPAGFPEHFKCAGGEDAEQDGVETELEPEAA